MTAWWSGGGKAPSAKKKARKRRPAAEPPVAPERPWWEVEETVWGAGHSGPVRGEFLELLTKPFKLTKASQLVVFGAGLGGGAREIMARHGAKLTAFEAAPGLAQAATAFEAGGEAGEPLDVGALDLTTATLPTRLYDGALAINALLPFGDKLGALKRIERSMKTRKQLVLLEPVLGPNIDPEREGTREWRDCEPEPVHLWDYHTLEGALKEAGFVIKDSSNLSLVYHNLIYDAWSDAVKTLRAMSAAERHAHAGMGELLKQCLRWAKLAVLLKRGDVQLYRVQAQVGEGKLLMSDW